MRVRMLNDRQVTVDGVTTIDAAAGNTYAMGDGVAASLVAAGHAEPLDGELANKDAGDAEETQAKPRRSRKKKSDLAAADGD